MYSLPIIKTEYAWIPMSPHLHVYQSPHHDPLILFTMMKSGKITMMNVTHFSPRKPPPFPLDQDVVAMTQKLRLDDDVAESGPGHNDTSGTGDEDETHLQVDEDPSFRPRSDLPRINGWDIEAPPTDSLENDLEICAMGMGGRLLIGVGTKGTIWVWHNDEP